MKRLAEIFSRLRKFLPLPCPLCRKGDGNGRNDFCPECRQRLSLIDRSKDGLCPGCGGINDSALACCSLCLAEAERPWLRAVAALEYRTAVRQVIHMFKYCNRPDLARPLGRLLAEAIIFEKLEFDIIVPVPLHRESFRKRGYNQAALLAEIVAGICGKPVRDLLVRQHRRSRQAGRNRSERHRALKGIFKLKNVAEVAGKKILLIDDVLTTGATLHSAAQEIKKGKPEAVFAAVAARTPGIFQKLIT